MKSHPSDLALARLVLVTIAASGLAPFADASVWFVKESAAPGGTGTSWATAFGSLDAALSATQDGDEVWVAAGTYRPSNPATGFHVTHEIELRGGFRGNESSVQDRLGLFDATYLEGDLGAGVSAQHVVTVEDAGTPLIDGFHIRNGNAGFGGGLGGGIWMRCSHLDLANSILASNRATRGGAIHIRGGCFGDGDDPNGGGGDYVLRIRDCAFRGNVASSQGGAIYGNMSVGEVWNSTFADNHAGYGGGVFLTNMGTKSAYTLVNCTFRSNRATSSGGAIYLAGTVFVSGGKADVINSTFAYNRAFQGGAIGTGTDYQGPGMAFCHLQNSIVWSNSAAADPGLSGTHQVEYSNVQRALAGAWPGPGNIDEDPLFVDGPDGRLQLGAGSKSIDAANYALLQLDSFDVDQDGISFEVIDVDLAGRDRLVDDPTAPNTGVPAANPFLDMGAYERQ